MLVQSLEEQDKFELKCARRLLLADEVIMRIFELAISENDRHGFQSLMWHISIVDRQGALSRQEYLMESHNKIRNYLLPDGKQGMCAFGIEDRKFFNSAGFQVSPPDTLGPTESNSINTGDLLFKIQKKR